MSRGVERHPVPTMARREHGGREDARDRALDRPAGTAPAATGGSSGKRSRERARPASGPFPPELHPLLTQGAGARSGIDALYSHQAQALEAAWSGPDVVTTGTASGKSLCFNLPTLDILCRDPSPGALPVPDQGPGPGPGARARRGWTTSAVRPPSTTATRREARAGDPPPRQPGLTNPDMLHVGILPHHEAWATFANLPSSWSMRRTSIAACSAHTCERAAAPAPDRRRLRHRAPIPARLGDHRQPGGARRAPDRPRGLRADRRRRLPTAGRDRDLEPAGHR